MLTTCINVLRGWKIADVVVQAQFCRKNKVWSCDRISVPVQAQFFCGSGKQSFSPETVSVAVQPQRVNLSL